MFCTKNWWFIVCLVVGAAFVFLAAKCASATSELSLKPISWQYVDCTQACDITYDSEPVHGHVTGRWSSVLPQDLPAFFGQFPLRLMETPTGVVGWYDSRSFKPGIRRTSEGFLAETHQGQGILLPHYQHDYSTQTQQVLHAFQQNPHQHYLRTVEPKDHKTKHIPWPLPPHIVPHTVITNAYWSGPGIVTNIHFDTRSGFVVQLQGRKRILLWPPNAHPWLYLHPRSHPLFRRSAADKRITPDLLKQYPLLVQAPCYEVLLSPDDFLYIPRGWFHYVETLDPNTVSMIIRFKH